MAERKPTSQQHWGGLGLNEALAEVTLEIHSAQRFIMDEVGYWPPHQHLDFELIMIVAGRYEATINDHAIELGAGELLLVQPQDWHEDRCPIGLDYCALHGRLRSGSRSVPFLAPSVPAVVRVLHGCADLVAATLEALEPTPRNAVEMALQSSRLQTLVWAVLQRIPAEHHAGSLRHDDPESLQRAAVRRCFEQYCRTPVAMARIAADLGISERQLRKLCAHLFGTSPAKAFTAYRLEQAREHIRHTDMSITEVARYFGFATPFHFSRLYKAAYGKAPSQHRKANPKAP